MDYCTRAIEKNRKTVVTKGRGIVKINERGEKIERSNRAFFSDSIIEKAYGDNLIFFSK